MEVSLMKDPGVVGGDHLDPSDGGGHHSDPGGAGSSPSYCDPGGGGF